MISLAEVVKNPAQFFALTSLYITEFNALLEYFKIAYLEWTEKFNWKGLPRIRKRGCGNVSKHLSDPQDQLFFVLHYLKTNPLQQSHAASYKMRQGQVSSRFHSLHQVLLAAQACMKLVPTRVGSEVAEHPFTLEGLSPQPSPVLKSPAMPMPDSQPISAEGTPADSPGLLSNTAPKGDSTLHQTTTTELNANTDDSKHHSQLELPLHLPPVGNPSEVVPSVAPATHKTQGLLVEKKPQQLVLLFGHLMVGFGPQLGLDATERRIERPRDAETQKLAYSGKQKTHTIKNTKIVNLITGIIVFLGATEYGTTHDKKAAEQDKIRFPDNSDAWMDSGYQGYEVEGARRHQPKKKPKGGELTANEKHQNRMISRVRVRVEHGIGGAKRMRIVKDEIRVRKGTIRDAVMLSACGLHNLRRRFRNARVAA